MIEAPDGDLLTSLASAESIPTLKTVATHVLGALDSGDGDLAHVASLIAQDPAMTAHILRISNSVVFNASGMSTTSIQEAVVRLGAARVRNLVVSLSVVDAFPTLDIAFDYPTFWRHCFTTALAAGEVAARSPGISLRGSPRDNPYFLAGLLHDIGTLLLCQQLGDEYVELVDVAMSEGFPIQEVEREALGFDHQDVGSALIRRWGLPFEVATAAECHHSVRDAPSDSLDYVLVVHGANLIGTGRGLPGDEIDGEQASGEQLQLDALGFDEAKLPELVAAVDRAAKDSELLVLVVSGR